MRVKVFAAIAAAAALAGALVWAQEPRRERRANLAAMQVEIGLSDQQAAEIRRIHSEERKAAIRRNAEMRIARVELDELMGAATLDEAAIAARVKTLGELQAASLKARTESRLAIRRLVTAEQYQKMQQERHRAVRARRARPMRRGASSVPDAGEDPAEADPS